MNKQKIMILTAPFGNGHVSVANELVNEINRQPHLEVVIYDLFTEDFPKTARFMELFHVRQYKRGLALQVYKYFYYSSDKLLKSWLANSYNNFGSKKLREKIELEKPDAIINTFPVNSSYYLKRFNIHIPIYTVITDYYANANWINEGIKRHFIASENIVGQLVKRNIHEDQFKVVGIPVKQAFYLEKTEAEREAIKDSYQINPNHKVVLLVAGAKGVVPKFKTIIKKLQNNENMTLLIVCGNNKKLYRSISKRFSQHQHIKVFGYVNTIYDMMFISDLMVTKPGGISITEASQIGLPLILYNPIPGQELENAIYFTAREGARIAYTESEVASQVVEIIGDTQLLNHMKKKIKKIGYKHSAQLIIESILLDIRKDNYANSENNEIT